MRVGSVTVILKKDIAAHESRKKNERLRLLDLIAKTKPDFRGHGKKKLDLLVLPAGFISVPKREMAVVARAVARRVSQVASLTIFGLDDPLGHRTGKGTGCKSCGARGAARPLPFYVFGASRGRLVWQPPSQRSARTADARPEHVGQVGREGRVVSTAGKRVGVLICGELLSRFLRAHVVDGKADAVVHLAHEGFKIPRAAKPTARTGPAYRDLSSRARRPVIVADHRYHAPPTGLAFPPAAAGRAIATMIPLNARTPVAVVHVYEVPSR